MDRRDFPAVHLRNIPQMRHICFSVLMQNDLSATEQEEFRIRCRSALDGLETLLQSLLEISKMETGLIQMNKKKLPLMDTVISAVNRTYPKADEKEIEFVFDYEKELETCTIMQDKRWLGEAVINVLDNAVKYSPCGSKIFIRLQKRNDLVRMEIEDQGIGIPQNEYPGWSSYPFLVHCVPAPLPHHQGWASPGYGQRCGRFRRFWP